MQQWKGEVILMNGIAIGHNASSWPDCNKRKVESNHLNMCTGIRSPIPIEMVRGFMCPFFFGTAGTAFVDNQDVWQ